MNTCKKNKTRENIQTGQFGLLSITLHNTLIKQFPLDNQKYTLGKEKHAHIGLTGINIAKKHATLVYSNGFWSIIDGSSMDGTYVNNERIIEYNQLDQYDVIRIQNYTISITENTLQESMDEPVVEQEIVKNCSAQYDNIPTLVPTINTQQQEKNTALFNQWRENLHQEIIQTFDLRRQNINELNDIELRKITRATAQDIFLEWKETIPSSIKDNILQAVIDDITGLGPLESLLKDPDISEIMVNAAQEIFVEKKGKIEKSPLVFANDNAVLAVIDKIITPLGRRIDQASPMVDARLKDGSRVNAIIPPLAIKGPCITIRKFPTQRLNMNNLVEFGSLSDAMSTFLSLAVAQGKNILVSGGTGTGKTTLLNVLSNQIPHHERVITIEDAAELQLNQPDLVALESKPANIEGTGAIQIRDLVKNALRMRPNRIVVGECRGAEALDMLQAMNTGHDGSLTTLHANTPRDALSRLEVMVMMAGLDIPVQAIREQVTSAIHIIVQQTRFACGARKITYITEVVGMEAGTIQLQDIFRYKRSGINSLGQVQGDFLATGFIPTFYETLAEFGQKLDTSIYTTNTKGINDTKNAIKTEQDNHYNARQAYGDQS